MGLKRAALAVRLRPRVRRTTTSLPTGNPPHHPAFEQLEAILQQEVRHEQAPSARNRPGSLGLSPSRAKPVGRRTLCSMLRKTLAPYALCSGRHWHLMLATW